MDAVQTQENEGSNPVQDVKVVTDGEPQDAKDLFESLETPAQLAALGFSDKTFLAAVARIAATLSRETSDGGKPSTEGRLRKGQYIFYVIRVHIESVGKRRFIR